MNEAADQAKYMTNLIRHIENNLVSDLDIKLLSNIGYVSYAHLYRKFYSLTGHSVKEYVRKRRLSNALALIKTSDFGLSDIAFQCGYSSHQALCRVLKQTLGLTPSEYKKGDIYYFFPPFNGKPLQSVCVSSETIPRMLRILFFHANLKNIENIAVNSFFEAFPEYGGRIFAKNGQQKGSQFCYELYLTDTNIDCGQLKLYGFEITNETLCFTATFATSTVRNDEREINAAWNYLYSEWLQNSMFEYTKEPYYEEYLLKSGKPVKLKLYLPIQKRCEETKITLINNPGLCFIAAEAKGHNAEKIASQTVIDYLAAHDPHILKTSKELYLYKQMNFYICGVKINSKLRMTSDENVRSIGTEQNNYLMLESNVMGDYDRYADLLFSFAQNNGIVADKKGIFAVYDAKDSFDNLKIRMYCPIKIDMK